MSGHAFLILFWLNLVPLSDSMIPHMKEGSSSIPHLRCFWIGIGICFTYISIAYAVFIEIF
jgi:hypothetical protein